MPEAKWLLRHLTSPESWILSIQTKDRTSLTPHSVCPSIQPWSHSLFKCCRLPLVNNKLVMINSILQGIGGIVAAAIITFAVVLGMAVIFSIPVWFLWNWIMVSTLHLFVNPLTPLQALGLNLLTGCLFKSPSASDPK